MAKQTDQTAVDETKARADALLEDVINLREATDRLMAERKAALDKVSLQYDPQINSLIDMMEENDKALKRVMKSAKTALFADTDIVYLAHGTLIHANEDRVTIPRDALAKCEELGFVDAIVTSKSLCREIVTRWSDEKLVMIGAERKPVEMYNYEIKKGEAK